MKYPLLLCVIAASLLHCQPNAEPPSLNKHIFYLHGRIVELQGTEAVSETFGSYKYQAIIDSLEACGATVHHEVRTDPVDFMAFCRVTSEQINQLVNDGVAPADITLIGASKGAVMAMQIAHLNEQPINYILLAANNEYIERENNWNLNGRILGIYDTSDQLAGRDYQYWIKRSTNAKQFEQLGINTGLGHGFLYQPLTAWLTPVREWIKTTATTLAEE